MTIKQTVNRLCRRNQTRNPFQICDSLGISVIFESLGTVRGYYACSYRFKVIHINCDLPEEQQMFTCAHELGHAILHPSSNTPFLRERTLFSVDKLELEANRFAMLLCYPADFLHTEYDGCTARQIAQSLNLPMQLVEYTLKQ